jgi:hypothetical protein
MVAEYPGCGGNGPQASLKIQLNFEFLYGTLGVEQIVLRPGNEPDQKFDDQLDWVQPGSLNLRDLGYFSLDNLSTIAATWQAYRSASAGSCLVQPCSPRRGSRSIWLNC